MSKKHAPPSATGPAGPIFEAKVGAIYWTLGAFDGLIVFDAPDEETCTALMLQLGSLGNVQTTTARAFTAAEMDKVLAKMGGG